MPLGKFTHSICEECWKKREPGVEPIRFKFPERETCCFCSRQHSSGIYVREHYADLPCNGTGGVHREES